MTVNAYVGLPGSGKSYGTVAHVVLPSLQKGRTVWTNLALNLELLEEHYPGCNIRLLENDQVLDVIDNESGSDAALGVVFVIDEAWRYWASGEQANRLPEARKSFLTEHRHRVNADGVSQQIVVVTQDLKDTSAFLRSKIDTTFRSRDLSKLGKAHMYVVDVYDGAVTGQQPSKKQFVRSTMPKKYAPEVYRYYHSHTMSAASEDAVVLEDAADERNNIMKSGAMRARMILAVALPLFGLALGWWTLDRMLGDDDSKAAQKTASAPVTKPVVSPAAKQAAAAPKPSVPASAAVDVTPKKKKPERTFSSTWRLVGNIGSADTTRRDVRVVLTDDRGNMRILMRDQACRRGAALDEWFCSVTGDKSDKESDWVSRFSGQGSKRGFLSGGLAGN